MTSVSPNDHNNSEHKRNPFLEVPVSPAPQYQSSADMAYAMPSPVLSPVRASPSPSPMAPIYGGERVLYHPGMMNSPMSYHTGGVPKNRGGTMVRGRAHTPHSPATMLVSPNSMKTPKSHGRKKSLVGFDPLLGDGTATSSNHFRRPSASPLVGVTAPYVPVAAPVWQHSPQPSQGNSKRKHRRDVQSFCVSDLQTISQQASEEETHRPEQRLSGAEESPNHAEIESRILSPVKSPEKSQLKASKAMSPKSKLTKGKNIFTITAPAKKDSPKSNSPKSDEAVQPTALESKLPKAGKVLSMTTPRSRKLPWPKAKGHRRTKSLEVKEMPSELSKANPRSSVDDAIRNSAMYGSFVQDLMEVKFDNLQIPSLAKPSPTSFLTGQECEVMRTCEYEAAPFQLEIPALSDLVVAARLNEFVDNYRRMDQNFDLEEWKDLTRMDLRQVKLSQHIPIAQLLLECGDNVTLLGVIASGTSADDRIEVAVFEGQRKFVAVVRGTTEQQMKPGTTKTKKKVAPFDSEHENVDVYKCFLDEYQKIETDCFKLLDKLTEEHPFCDVVFTGHSFGAALATLASARYSNARPMMRVACYPMGSPKVGLAEFRHMVNSTPNLRMVRLEYGQDGKCQLPSQSASHVGHTLVLHGSLGQNSTKSKSPVLAYKFETPKSKKFKTTYPDLRSYVAALEEIARLELPWVRDFVGISGKGVVVNNEKRQMV